MSGSGLGADVRFQPIAEMRAINGNITRPHDDTGLAAERAVRFMRPLTKS